jgi:hypothetical protein
MTQTSQKTIIVMGECKKTQRSTRKKMMLEKITTHYLDGGNQLPLGYFSNKFAFCFGARFLMIVLLYTIIIQAHE